jgi:uncharacterized protein (DUF433 family)
MAVMNWRDHIVCDPAILCGKPTLKGTRLSVEFVLDLLASGSDRAELFEDYPNLTEVRVQAALAFAADTIRQTDNRIVLPDPHNAQPIQVEFRFAKGTQLNCIRNLRYMLQLMACLEAINSAIRWGVYVENDLVGGIVRDLDKFMVWFVGVGWCHEAFELLRARQAKEALDRSMLNGQHDLLNFWDRVVSEPPDQLITKIKDIRNKYFGHFDSTVVGKFIDWQARLEVSEPFFAGDGTGHPIRSRFLWPLAACVFDLHGDPSEGVFGERVDKMLASLEDVIRETGNLLQTLIEAWMVRSGLNAESAWEFVDVRQE